MGTRDVTDAGLKHLRGLPHLKRLRIWDCGVTDGGVEALQGSYRAAGQELEVSYVPNYDGSVMESVRNAGGRVLSLLADRPMRFRNASQIDEVDVILNANCLPSNRFRNLRIHSVWGTGEFAERLYFQRSRRMDVGCSVQLWKYPLLEELYLEHTDLTDASLVAMLAALPRLKTLVLGESRVTEAGLAAFGVARPGSRALRLRYNQGYSREQGIFRVAPVVFDLQTAAALPWVRKIEIRQRKAGEIARVKDNDLPWVRQLPDLEELDLLGASHITDAGLVHLQDHPRLRVVNLMGSGVTVAGVAALAESYRKLGRHLAIVFEANPPVTP